MLYSTLLKNWKESKYYYFIQGNFNYYLDRINLLKYFNNARYLSTKARLENTKNECLILNECVNCGCKVPQMQYSDKSCECYDSK